MSSSSSSSREIVLLSSDGMTFRVEEAVARQAKIIESLIDDDCADGVIPVATVKGRILDLVIKFSKQHVNPPANEDKKYLALKAWDAEFVKVLDQNTLFDVIMAANYLNIPDLLDLTCQTVADMMKGKTPKAIRKIFGIKKDYSMLEEDEVLRENSWAFEGLSYWDC